MEEIFELKRFPKDKHEQIAGLVQYATLMGLTGRDLVSIGGKMDRDHAKKERARRKEICESMVTPLRGQKKAYPNFKITMGGRQLTARRQHSSEWKFYDDKGRVVGTYEASWRYGAFTYGRDYSLDYFYQMLWDIYEGKFTV